MNIWQYQFRVFVLPGRTHTWQQPLGQCIFAGLSAIGGIVDPQGSGSGARRFGAALISGDVVDNMSVFFHEMG